MSFRPGTEIGSYRITAPLGEGGMGVVFVVEHRLLDRKFALKLLRPELSADQERVAGFLKEARAVSRVSHEHVVDVTDVGTTPRGQCYYVMELLSGESLGRRLRVEGPWPVERTLHVGVQIAEALTACHAAGVVHRDLKPDNVFLVRRGADPDFVKLLDFGVVKMVDAPPDGAMRTSHPTREGTVVGTPQYMSPEQCRGRREIDHRSDLYSLGIVLYRMVMGRVPFDSDDWTDVLIQQATSPLPPMAARRPDLPPDFERLVEKAVAKKPADRWQNAAQMRRAMLELLALLVGSGSMEIQVLGAPDGSAPGPAPGGPLLAIELLAEPAEPGPGDVLEVPAAPGRTRSLTPATPSLPLVPLRRRRRGTWLALSLLLCIVVVAAAALPLRSGVPAAPPPAAVPAEAPPAAAPRPVVEVTPATPAERAAEPAVAAPVAGPKVRKPPTRRLRAAGTGATREAPGRGRRSMKRDDVFDID